MLVKTRPAQLFHIISLSPERQEIIQTGFINKSNNRQFLANTFYK